MSAAETAIEPTPSISAGWLSRRNQRILVVAVGALISLTILGASVAQAASIQAQTAEVKEQTEKLR